MNEEEEKSQIFVFVPISACGCNYSKFMDRIFAEFIPYNNYLDVQVKDIQGEEVKNYRLFNNSVVILNPPNRDNPLIFTSYFELRNFLQKYFRHE